MAARCYGQPSMSAIYATARSGDSPGGQTDGVSDAAEASRHATGSANNPIERIATRHPAISAEISDQATIPLARPPREHRLCSATPTSTATTAGTATARAPRRR
jgi:hypothetical protein